MQIGDDADTRQPNSPFNHFHPGLQQALITTEFIDHESLEQCPVGRLQELQRSEQRSKYSATINISNEYAGSMRCVRHAEIDDIVLLQIDFCRRSSPFEQDEVVLRRQPPIALKDGGE